MKPHPTIKLPVAELKTAIGGFTKVIPRHSTLPVLGMVHVERDRQGWVHLTATDLDTFLTIRLEAPAQIGDPAKCLVPFTELQKLGKTCLADEILDLEVLSEDNRIHKRPTHGLDASEDIFNQGRKLALAGWFPFDADFNEITRPQRRLSHFH